MTGSDTHTRDGTAHEARLESWKAIARYLGRTVRTVQRWEKDEGLPVYRHHHRKRGSVYAITHELDEWRNSRAPLKKPGFDYRLAASVAVIGVFLLIFFLLWNPPGARNSVEMQATSGEAYRHYSIGAEFLRNRMSQPEDHAAAAAAFERAIAVDPSYSQAYGGLALARAIRSTQMMDREQFAEARGAAQTALAINPDLADAHVALGIVYLQEGSILQAEQSLRRALREDPRHAYGGYWLSNLLREQEQFGDSDTVLRNALQADPLHPLLNTEYARRLWEGGRFEQSVAHYEKVLEAPDAPADVLFNLYAVHHEFGRLDIALHWAMETARVKPVFTGLNALIMSYSALGMTERADFWYRQLQRAEKNGPPRLGIHSQYLYRIGDIEGAYQLKVQYVENNGRKLSDMPFAVRETFGGMAILSGRLDEGIGIMEELFGDEPRLPYLLGGSSFAMTFSQVLAWAYLEQGRPADARRICDAIAGRIDELRAIGSGYSPSFYVVHARNFVLLGSNEQALAALRRAVDLGWRDAQFERPIPIWRALEGHDEYLALMNRVQTDVKEQRERVEKSSRYESMDAVIDALIDQHVLGLDPQPAQ